MHAEWQEAKKLNLVTGSGSPKAVHKYKVKWNLMFSPRLTFTFPMLRSKLTPQMAWDVHFWKYWRHVSRASRLIYSDYRAPFENCERLWAPRLTEKGSAYGAGELSPAWLHGCKEMASIGCVRDRLICKNRLDVVKEV